MAQGRGVKAGPGQDLDASAVRLPSRARSPLQAVVMRAMLAIALVVLATIIVYLERGGYRDATRPGQPLSFLASAYYATVTLSTTGYGDIVPVTAAARLVNTVVITPIRVVFLIVLIGTTLEVLTERTRRRWRIARWRSRVTGHTVLVGYGTKGRSALASMREAGGGAESIVVVDIEAHPLAEANRAGLVAVHGDAARKEALLSAGTEQAARMLVAVGRDDTAVLITLTARQLNPRLHITAAVRESENEPLLRQSGADQVVVSSAAAGRLLGLSCLNPAVGALLGELLNRGRGLDLTARPADDGELGRPALETAPNAVAVLRAGEILAVADPRAGQLREGDQLVVLAPATPGS